MSVPRVIEFVSRTAHPTENVPAGEVWLYSIGSAFFYKDDAQNINSVAQGITREQVEDILQNSFADTASINWVYNDTANVFEATVAPQVLQDILDNANAASANATAIGNNASDISTIQTEQTAQDTAIGNNASDISTIQTEQTAQDTAIAAASAAAAANLLALNGHVSDNNNPHATGILNLSDTSIATPVEGQLLVRRGLNWVNEPGLERVITQAGHGFTISNNVPLPAYTLPSGVIALAQADAIETLSAFYITRIIDANTFVIKQQGLHTATAHGLNIGRYYFLSNTVLGGITLVQPTVTLDDVCFFTVDANTVALIDNRPVDKANIEKFLIKVVNDDTTTNLSQAIMTTVPWNVGAPQINENSFYTTGTNSIVIPVSRSYSLGFNIHIFSSAARPNIRTQFHRNGLPVGAIGATGYIRNTTGHNESSLHLTEKFSLEAGDVIDVRSQNETTVTGAVTMAVAGTSNFWIEAR